MSHKNCQSCGMPLASREGHQGADPDKSLLRIDFACLTVREL